MRKHPNVLWLVALVLGGLLDFLFWRQGLGVNFALYALLCLCAGFILLRLDGKRLAPAAALLIPLILFFAAITFIRAEPLTQFVGVSMCLLCMVLLAVSFLDGSWLRTTALGYAAALFRLGFSLLVRPLVFINELRRERIESGRPAVRFNPWPVLRGAAIAIPVLLVFGALLASADIVFGAQLRQWIEFLHLEKLPEYVFRLIYILAAAYALAGVFLHASGYGRTDKPAASNGSSSLAFLGFTEAAIVLGGVIVLFAAFVLVQFRYFFGGQVNIGVEGYTYSEYARRGFGELVFVAFFSLLMILVLSAVTRRATAIQRRLFSGMGVTTVALVLVMLVSAYQRLALYEAAYGFSRLRTYTHVLLVWIGVLLVAVIVLEVLRRERAFATAALLAGLGFGVSLALLNVDGFIVRENVARAMQGEQLDTGYLSMLSDDSVPVVAQIYQAASTPAWIREAMGAVLACGTARSSHRADRDWRSFSLSRSMAVAALVPLRDALSRYQYVDKDWPPRVVTPDGTGVYTCVEFNPD